MPCPFLSEIETIVVHHFAECRCDVLCNLGLCIAGGIHLGTAMITCNPCMLLVTSKPFFQRSLDIVTV